MVPTVGESVSEQSQVCESGGEVQGARFPRSVSKKSGPKIAAPAGKEHGPTSAESAGERLIPTAESGGQKNGPNSAYQWV
jgi:hypothetical protein